MAVSLRPLQPHEREVSNVAVLEPLASRPTSLTEIVQEAIRDAIVSRRLSPGDRVTEAALAKQLNVSKTPVREALLKLEYIGLIESDGGRGGRIIKPTRETIRAAYEVRMGLETQAARQLAQRGDAALLTQPRLTAEACLSAAEADDHAGFRDFDRQFHLALAQATGNPLLSRFIRDSFDLTWTLRDRDVPVTDDSVDCARQHLDIMQAMQSGSAQAAEDGMRGHLEYVLDLVISTFERQLAQAAGFSLDAQASSAKP